MNIIELDWDSHFFGYKVGKIVTDQILTQDQLIRIKTEAKNKNIKLIHLFSEKSNEIIENHGTQLVDTKVTYVKEIEENEKLIHTNLIESYSKSFIDADMIALAIESGMYSRYKNDLKIRYEKFEELYITWLKNSIDGNIADYVFVYRIKKKNVGFITLGKKNERASIGLIAVDKNARGKGIGKELIKYAINISLQNSFDKIEVVTQENNKPACTLYEKMNFKIEKKEVVYHLWM